MHLGCTRTLATGSNVAEGAAGGESLPSPSRATRPTIRSATMAIVSSSRRPEQSILERQLANAFAGRGKDRVGDRGSGDGGAWFADSARRGSAANEVHLDRGGFVDAH